MRAEISHEANLAHTDTCLCRSGEMCPEPVGSITQEAIRRRLGLTPPYRVRLTRDMEIVQWGGRRQSGPPGLAWTDLYHWTVLKGEAKTSAGVELSKRWDVALNDTHDMVGHLLVVGASKILLAKKPKVRLADLLTSHFLFGQLERDGLTRWFLSSSARLLNEVELEPALVMSPNLASALKEMFSEGYEALRKGKDKEVQGYIRRASQLLTQAADKGHFRTARRLRHPWPQGEIRPWQFVAPRFEHVCIREFWSAVDEKIPYRICETEDCFRPFAVRGNLRYCPRHRLIVRVSPQPSAGEKRLKKLLSRYPTIGKRRAESIVRAFHRLEVKRGRPPGLTSFERAEYSRLHKEIYGQ